MNSNKQIPNSLVYGALYAVTLGISVWLLAFHKENPTNWLLYPLNGAAVVAAAVKFALQARRAADRLA